MAESTKIISAPYISIDGLPLKVQPNSISYTIGKGEQTVKTLSIGGGAVDTVTSDNVETKFSKLKFKAYSTIDAINEINNWKDRNGLLLVQVAGVDESSGQTLNLTFQKAVLINDVEVFLKESGDAELEFHSAPVI